MRQGVGERVTRENVFNGMSCDNVTVKKRNSVKYFFEG